MGTLVVFRPKTTYRDRARRYRILLDGSEVAQLRHGESARLDVEAGRHAVQARIDWATTPELAIEVVEGATVALRCEPGGSVLSAFVRPKAYLRLTQVDEGEIPADA
jgi:hypothetical protein